jgi:hypothetical protein
MHPIVSASFERPPGEPSRAPSHDHVCVHQVGRDQKGLFEFYEQEILPNLKTIRSPGRRRTAGSRRRRRR